MSNKEETESYGAWKVFVAIGIILIALVGFYAVRTHRQATGTDENTYNGFTFGQTQSGLWVTRIQVGKQPYDIPFYYHPTQTLTVGKTPDATDPILKGHPQQIIISVDPDAGATVVVAAVEIARLTGSKYDLFNIPTSSALSRPDNKSLETPVITCKDATNETVVIQFVKDTQNAIVRDGSCVILFYTTPEESVRVADRYAYMLLRIMY